MADTHQFMKAKLDEYSKKNPELSYRFIDSSPDILRIRTQIDGYQVVKETGSGTAGEVRCGDLLLAARPMKDAEEERAHQKKKNRDALSGPSRQYYSQLERDSGGMVKPMLPEEIARGGAKWTNVGGKK